MADRAQMPVRCHGCAYFFITHEPQRPYGCTKFGFKAKSCQRQLSLKQLAHNVHTEQRVRPQRVGAGKTRVESLMAGELNSIQESIKLALDAADAATDVTSEYSQVKREHKKLEKSVTDSPLHHHYFCHRNCCGGCGADVFRHTVF